MNWIVIYKSKKKALMVTIGGFLIKLAGCLLLQYTNKNVIRWCFIILSAFVLTLGASTFFNRKPKILLTSQGIPEIST